MTRDNLCIASVLLAVAGLSLALWTSNGWFLLIWLVGGLGWVYWAKTEAP